MPNRNIQVDYRYAFQGQEKDPETGKEAFELRLWDSRIGRWLTTDPFSEFFSPYLGMGNNPILNVDPSGGCTNARGEDCIKNLDGTATDFAGNDWSFADGTWSLDSPEALPGIFLGSRADYAEVYNRPGWDFYNQVVEEDFYAHIYRGQNEAAGYLLDILPTPIAGVSITLKAGSKLAKAAKRARRLGNRGENFVANKLSLIKNKVGIESISGTTKNGAKRFPDFLTANTLIEVKNTKALYLTNQIKDYMLWSVRNNRKFILYTRAEGGVKISKPLQALIDNGYIERRILGGK